MPETSCFKLADNLDFADGALSEPLAIGMYAVELAQRLCGDLSGKKILILGSGPIGLSVLSPLKTLGAAPVFMTDKLDYRLELARAMGADFTANPDRDDVEAQASAAVEGGFNIAFECCGDQAAVDQELQLLRPGGKLLIIGIPPTLERWSFPVDVLRHREICIQNVRRQLECTEKTLEWMAEGRLPKVRKMITHNFSFEETPAAFELVSGYRDGVVKAMINF